jgi:1,2-diacylglycerol 3-beta-glucosyltransferase
MIFVSLIILLAVPGVLVTGYLFLLTALSRRPEAAPTAPARLRFDIVVPAHDEEAGIARTVRSLRAVRWPADRFRVLVVADNCRDETAKEAARAGAIVTIRDDPDRRGKGYALEMAFQRVLADGFADAAVVVDADTVVMPDLLAGFAARLEAGAGAVQARYGVLNPDASWRTRLMTVALALVNDLRSLGRERLLVSCGLRGNGMCFSTDALRRVPYRAFSLVEDLEHAIHLGQAGLRVAYAPEVVVLGEMVSGGAAARSQRRRWDEGRRALARSLRGSLLWQGIRRRDPVLVDLAIDLLVPSLARLVTYLAVGTAVSVTLAATRSVPVAALAPWIACWAFLAAYVLRGVHLAGLGLRGIGALAWAPVYLAWKVTLLGKGSRGNGEEWVRTRREAEPDPAGHRAAAAAVNPTEAPRAP